MKLNKKYVDETILQERKRRMEKVLDEGVDLERDLPDGYLCTVAMQGETASIKIPAFMEDLPPELAEHKYGFEPRPQIIKTCRDGNVDFTFSLLDVLVAPSELAQAFGECRKFMARINPEWVYYGQGEEDIHGIKVCWAEYSNNAVGGKIYNLLFFAATEKVFMGTLNCPYNDHALWMKIGKLCMRTLRGKAYDGTNVNCRQKMETVHGGTGREGI